MKVKTDKFENQTIKYYTAASVPIISVFFILPFELYYNSIEYWNWNYTLPITFLLIGLFFYILLAIGITILLKLNQRICNYFSTFLLFIGIFILFADVFSPLQASLLDGTKITSSEPIKYTLLELGIFSFLLIAIIKINNRLLDIVKIYLPFVLIIISIVYLFIILFTTKPMFKSAEGKYFNKNIIGNIYHIVLDEMQSDVALIGIEEKKLPSKLQGFTIYKNNISNYLYTSSSFPSYMTGSIYNKGSFSEWQKSFNSNGLIHKLHEFGYRIVFFPARRSWCNSDMSECVTLGEFFENKTKNITKYYYKDYFQIWIARIMPNVFTNEALAIGKEIGDTLLEKTFGFDNKLIPKSIAEGKEPFSSVLMLKELIITEKERPSDGQYIYAHALIPHGPYVINDNGEYDPNHRSKGTSAYYTQVKYALDLLMEFIDELKLLGRYDKSTIVIHADTGHGHRGFIYKKSKKLIGTAETDKKEKEPIFNNSFGWSKDQLIARTMALLMIKPPNNKEDLQFSETESQLIDIYPTILDLTKITDPSYSHGGKSLYGEKIVKARKSYFYLYPAGSIEPDIKKIRILNVKNIYNSNAVFEDYLIESQVIDLPSNGISYNLINDRVLNLQGFSGVEFDSSRSKSWRWAVGNKSKIVFAGIKLKEQSQLLVTINVRPLVVNINKYMTIKTQIDQSKVRLKKGWNKYSFPLYFPKGEKPYIDIFYENYASPKSMQINNDVRKLSVNWAKIDLKHANPTGHRNLKAKDR